MKRFSLVFLIFLWGYHVSYSGDAGSVVKVGIHIHEPFVFVDSDDKATGIFPEILAYVADQEGWKIEYVPGTMGQCLSRLENGEVDMVCALGFSEVMDRYYDFNGENLVTDWTRNSESEISDISPSPVYYAVLQGTNKELLSAIDYHVKILKSTDNSVYYKSLEKWSTPDPHPMLPGWIKWGLVGILTIVLVLFWGNRVLRNRVRARTRDLIQELIRRKQAEEDLKKSEERYREFFEENISGSYIVTPEGQVIACNKEYKRIFQFATTQEALDTPLGSLFEDPSERDDFLIRLKKEKRIIGYEPRLKKVGGRPVHITVNVSGVFDAQGNLKRIRGFVLDVSEQRRLEAQLRQAQKMETIGTLAGGIAHDFNNILFPILGHTEMLLHDTPENSPAHDRLKKIYAGGIRARDLVRQILTFSRQDTNEKEQVHIQPIIEEALTFLSSSIPTNIDIHSDIHGDWGVIQANPTQIHQIVMNLITNAYQAMEETGGTIGVSLKERVVNEDEIKDLDINPGSYACLTVSDTGRGMDEQIRQKIFDPFFTTKEKGKGTGMGLSVVHGIVQNMGGAIQTLSKPGLGTTFHVYLPLALNFPEALEIENPESFGKKPGDQNT